MSKTKTKRRSKRKTGLNIVPVPEAEGRGQLLKSISASGCAAVLYLGLMLSLLSMFGIPAELWWVVLPGLIPLFLLGAEGKIKKIVLGLCGLLLAALLILILLKQTPLYQGMLLVCNQALEQLGMQLGVMKDSFLVTADPSAYGLYMALFLIVFSIEAAAVCRALSTGNNPLLLLLLLPLLALQLIFGVTKESWPLLLLLLGCFLLLGSRVLVIKNNGVFLEQLGGLILIFLVVLLVLGAIFPAAAYQPFSAVSSMKHAISSRVEALRYELHPTNSLPEGDFLGLGDLTLTDHTALKVVMDKPVSQYLRGFVGSVYTGSGWEETPGGDFYSERELFYGLHENGFQALNQLPTVYRLEHSDTKEEPVQVTVQNIGANSRYLYLPYELESDPMLLDEASVKGDERVVAEGLRGNRLYQYQTASNLVKLYPQMAADFYMQKDEERFQSYTEAESHYNAYVYRQYTEVPEEIRSLLLGQLGMEEAAEGSHAAYEEANAAIMGYLNKNISYSEEVAEFSDGDFLRNFLQVTAKGYSVHYASAAVMMYRYLGIPARYVEGYLITPELVQNAEPYEELLVTGKEAHAWVEIYQDGIGWVPMEVTPPYLDKMERPDYEIAASTSTEEEGETDGSENGAAETVLDQKPDENPPEKNPERNLSAILRYVLIGALLMVGILLVLLFLYLFIQRRKLRQYLRRLAEADDRSAVCLWGQYLERWMLYVNLWDGQGSRYLAGEALTAGFGAETAKEYEAVVEIIQKSAYSERPISPQERKRTEDFARLLQQQILKQTTLRKKLRMRLWDFLY